MVMPLTVHAHSACRSQQCRANKYCVVSHHIRNRLIKVDTDALLNLVQLQVLLAQLPPSTDYIGGRGK